MAFQFIRRHARAHIRVKTRWASQSAVSNERVASPFAHKPVEFIFELIINNTLREVLDHDCV